MTKSLLVPLIPAVSLLLSAIFLICLHWKNLPRCFQRGRAYTHVRHTASDSGCDSDSGRSDYLTDDSDYDEEEETAELSTYFHPHTHLLLHESIVPTTPPTPTWERSLHRRIAAGAWIDCAVDAGVHLIWAKLDFNSAFAYHHPGAS